MGRVIGIRPLSEEKFRPAFALLEIAGIELTVESIDNLLANHAVSPLVKNPAFFSSLSTHGGGNDPLPPGKRCLT